MDNYNNIRLHSTIGYVAPKNKIEGRESLIFTDRKHKLSDAIALRKAAPMAANQGVQQLGEMELAEAA